MISVEINYKTRQQYCKGTNTLECWQWCIDNFGSPTTTPIRWGWDTYRLFFFKYKEDATLFALRWQ